MASENHSTDTIDIPLTRNKVAIIDSSDYDLVAGYHWYTNVGNTTFYAVSFARRLDGSPQHLRMHRILMNAPDDLQVDHIDGNGLNNSRCNLRLATRAENTHNQRIREGTSSRYKGVVLEKRYGRWMARVGFNGIQYYLGMFGSEEDAARAYDQKALELFGEFAKLNFPNGA
jgi:hypothetical protein